jgi:predicted short-subunit dehydrogenase-like oxidoreductase (DUF2520 family)
MARICMIGAGNVATHLGIALQSAGHEICLVYSRTTASAEMLADKLSTTYTSSLEDVPSDCLSIIAVKDDAIEEIAKELKGPVAHTSGSKAISILGSNPQAAVFYPLQTFSKDKKVSFEDIPLCIEANNKELEEYLLAIAKSLSKRVHLLSSEQRKHLHTAAVFSCNFSNLMYQLAEEICQEQSIPFNLLQPLIAETSQKLEQLSPKDAQTGPAHRKDTKTIKKQLKLLEGDAEKQQLYQLLTDSIIKRS